MNRQTSQRIICLGAAFWDTIFKIDKIPTKGCKVLPEAAVQKGSGMAVAAAAAIARLGGEVSLWTRVGEDALGSMFIDELTREGVDTRHVRRSPGGHTAFSSILVDAAGERLVVPHFDNSLDADARWLPLHEIRDAGAVLCDMRWVEGTRAVLQEAHRQNVPAILDADVAPVADLRSLIGLADHLLFSEPALLSLVEAASPQDAVLAIARQVDAQVIGVTLGERGSLLWRRSAPDELLHVSTLQIRAMDTLNAGDIWHGTYALGLVLGWPLEQIAIYANVAAAIKCERFGGWAGAPRLDQLQARVRLATDAAGAEGLVAVMNCAGAS